MEEIDSEVIDMMIECRLNVILAERGIKKTEFSHRIGIRAGTLSQWCGNKRLPKMEEAYRASLELDLNVMEIWKIKKTCG